MSATQSPTDEPGHTPRRPGQRASTPRNGFTLIELLVVVSIIALLIAILLPSLRQAREQARVVKCLAHVRGLGQASFVFTQDHHGRFQLAAADSAVNTVDPDHTKYAYDENGELLAWPVALGQAMGFEDYQRNSDWGVLGNTWVAADQNRRAIDQGLEIATCPSDKVKISTPFYPRPGNVAYWGYLSYAISEDIVGANDLPEGGPLPACWKNGYKGQLSDHAGDRLLGNLDKVFDPGTALLMIDAGPESIAEARSISADPIGQYAYANLIISAQARGPYLGDAQLTWRKRIPRARHPGGRLNVLFADFHGSTIKPVEFWTDRVVKNLPIRFAPRVRISPYRPWKEEEE